MDGQEESDCEYETTIEYAVDYIYEHGVIMRLWY